MKHKKLQKKGDGDDDDLGDANEDSDVTFDESMNHSDDKVSNEATLKVPEYDVEHLLGNPRTGVETKVKDIEHSDDSSDEIDVVESEDEKSWQMN